MQHLIQSIDDPIFDYLSGYLAYRRADNSKITIRHLLTMSSGIEWEEDRSYADGENDENRMEKSSEPVAFVLQRPLDHPPGAQWKYNSGGVQVLAAIIRSVSGLDIDQFAAQYLFKPLGIVNYQWIRMRPGFPAAASGLRLTSRDMLKLGWLYLEKGAWDHVQVLPAAWVIQSLQTQVLRDSQTRTRGYGFLFWTFSDSVNGQSFDISAAVGNGGQRIFINQAHRLVVVITAGNYNNFAIEKNGEYALSKFILPSLHEGP
jgi:CubicO group peptidase (beta-lactamase class C family)